MSGWGMRAIGLGLAGLAASVFGANSSVLVNGSAATVGKALITVQDAYFFDALNRFKDGAAVPTLYPDPEELRKTVQRMILEEMVTAEMKNLEYQVGPRSEAEGLLRTSRGKNREGQLKELLARFGKSETAAVEQLWQSLKVEKFIQRKIETLTPIITEAELERYYRQSPGKFGEGEFEKLKPEILQQFKRERMQKSLEEWVRFLKQKYGVVNHLDA